MEWSHSERDAETWNIVMEQNERGCRGGFSSPLAEK